MSNALAALNISLSTQDCEKICKTSATEGTPPRQLVRGLSQVDGLEPRIIRETRPEVALLQLSFSMMHGRPVILLVDRSCHWVAAVGQLGPRVLIADSADNELVLSLDANQILARWESSEGPKFYGVIL